MIFNQVIKLCKTGGLFKFYNFTNTCGISYKRTVATLSPLDSRRLLRVSGTDVSTFLQGLITNDMKHFEDGAMSIYTMFLNTKGRVFCETLIYKYDNNGSYLLECDKDIITNLTKHLSLYKLRRKIQIQDVSNDLKVWVMTAPKEDISTNLNNLVVYKDPRLSDLGCRIVAESAITGERIAQDLEMNIDIKDNSEEYEILRYRLGVSEGVDELPPGSCYPLEYNCDYLHGVSFHKGCYVGQELTARVHHTGVVRKRIMPLKFENVVNELANDSVISTDSDSKLSLGKLKGYRKNYGIGLMRIKESLEAQTLVINNYTVSVSKPEWWPKEAPKDKVKLS